MNFIGYCICDVQCIYTDEMEIAAIEDSALIFTGFKKESNSYYIKLKREDLSGLRVGLLPVRVLHYFV